jgi:hypothetical protein
MNGSKARAGAPLICFVRRGAERLSSSFGGLARKLTAPPLATPRIERRFCLGYIDRDPGHTKGTQHGASKAPRSPRAGPRTGERAAPRPSGGGGLCEVRMSTRNFRAHDAPATERHGEMARSGRLAAVSAIAHQTYFALWELLVSIWLACVSVSDLVCTATHFLLPWLSVERHGFEIPPLDPRGQ